MSENTNLSAKEKTEKELFIGKSISFYETFLNSWIQNRMEVDKSILTLSSLAIGLLVTFLSNSNNEMGFNIIEFILWIFSIISFVMAIITILVIFYQNSDYIGGLISPSIDKKKLTSIEGKLRRNTLLSFIFFIVGVVLTFALAIMQSGFTLCKVAL